MAGQDGFSRFAFQGASNRMNGEGMDREGRWDPKTQTLVASLEALLRLHREQVAKESRDDGGSKPTPEAAPPTTSP